MYRLQSHNFHHNSTIFYYNLNVTENAKITNVILKYAKIPVHDTPQLLKVVLQDGASEANSDLKKAKVASAAWSKCKGIKSVLTGHYCGGKIMFLFHADSNDLYAKQVIVY